MTPPAPRPREIYPCYYVVIPRENEVAGARAPAAGEQLAGGEGEAVLVVAVGDRRAVEAREVHLELYPIVTSQYSTPTSYQVSYHIQSLFF